MAREIKGHYVPLFYLKGFTKSGEEGGQLHVFDKGRCKAWASLASRSASEGGMYGIEPQAGVDADAVERAFSGVEGVLARVLREMIESRSIPTGESRDILLNFIAFSFARTPRAKSLIHEATDRFFKEVIRKHFSGSKGFERLKEHVEQAGRSTEGLEYEKYQEFLKAGFSVSPSKANYIGHLVDRVGAMLPLLAQRAWSLWPVADDAPNLICSDSPVSQTWEGGIRASRPANLHDRNTVIRMPLHRRLALVGTDSMMIPSPLDLTGVAKVNIATAAAASQIYSSEADFVWLKPDRELGSALELLNTPGGMGGWE
jgi:hypothetical protein